MNNIINILISWLLRLQNKEFGEIGSSFFMSTEELNVEIDYRKQLIEANAKRALSQYLLETKGIVEIKETLDSTRNGVIFDLRMEIIKKKK